jgi:hypothetical protein
MQAAAPLGSTEVLVGELHRQKEDATYTAAALFLWLHTLRFVEAAGTAAQIVLAALAGWKVLAQGDGRLAAILALLATIIPAVLKALKVDEHLKQVKAAAAEFSAIRDGSRRAARLGPSLPYAKFAPMAQALFERRDAARRNQADAPDIFFWLARRRVARGIFEYDYAKQQDG